MGHEHFRIACKVSGNLWCWTTRQKKDCLHVNYTETFDVGIVMPIEIIKK